MAPTPALDGTLAVLRILPRVSRARTVLLALGVLAGALAPIGVAILTGLLVGSIPAALRGGLDAPAGHHALTLLAAAGALIVATRVLTPVLAALATTFGREVDRHMQERTMAAVSGPSGLAHLEDPAILNLIASAQRVGTGDIRPGDAVPALASLLPSWLQALGSALILAAFQWWLGLAWVALWPLVMYYLQREYIRVGEIASGQAGAVRRAEYYRDLALTPGAAKEVRIWGMLDWLETRFEAAWRAAMRPAWQARRPGRPALWLSTAVVTALNMATFGLLAWSAARGALGLAALAVYTRAALDANAFRAFDDANTRLAYAAVSAPSLLALERHLDVGRDPTTIPTRLLPADSPRQSIRFEGVTFRYPGQSANALADLDLAIPAGRSLAIVGVNGAGKTSLIKLLCRLYDPSAGRVSVDGVDLRDVDARAWQRRVAAIFQDFAQYHLPARDNIVLGAPELADDPEGLRRAAHRAGALDLVESLPRGWDTVLSRQYTDGADLSGGQWQRIALARALFAVEGGARVLILDEPTASLDVRAEADLYDRFLNITAGLTTIIISHRFSTVRRADRICVLAGGRVAEEGAHDELVALGGRYAEMFALQAARFTDGYAARP